MERDKGGERGGILKRGDGAEEMGQRMMRKRLMKGTLVLTSSHLTDFCMQRNDCISCVSGRPCHLFPREQLILKK